MAKENLVYFKQINKTKETETNFKQFVIFHQFSGNFHYKLLVCIIVLVEFSDVNAIGPQFH